MARRGRKKHRIAEADFVCEPTDTMLLLANTKNGERLSWRELAEKYLPDYSHAYVRKIALGYAQSDNVDIALGLKEPPPPTVEVPPCPHCGEAHTVDWCVKEEGEPKKPKNGRGSSKPRPPRLQIRKDDPASAAASIRRNLPAEIVKRLKDLL